MAGQINVQKGMEVYDGSNQTFGTVERVAGSQFFVQGKAFSLASVTRIEGNRVYLSGAAGIGADQGNLVIPVVEEQLQVGIRQVAAGEVRVTTDVIEKPVETQVNLREEEVHIERRPVNRSATSADLAAMKNGVIEVTETDEEAVVSKQARVVEEVVINKEVKERTETIRDTVRRTDVEVKNLEGVAPSQPMSNFSDYDTDFRQNYQTNYLQSGYTYDQYQPAYEFGTSLFSDTRYKGNDWNSIQTNVQQNWEQKNPGTWDQFKDSIQYAWGKVSGQTK